MKKKELNKKLILKKETITSLEKKDLINIKGGGSSGQIHCETAYDCFKLITRFFTLPG